MKSKYYMPNNKLKQKFLSIEPGAEVLNKFKNISYITATKYYFEKYYTTNENMNLFRTIRKAIKSPIPKNVVTLTEGLLYEIGFDSGIFVFDRKLALKAQKMLIKYQQQKHVANPYYLCTDLSLDTKTTRTIPTTIRKNKKLSSFFTYCKIPAELLYNQDLSKSEYFIALGDEIFELETMDINGKSYTLISSPDVRFDRYEEVILYMKSNEYEYMKQRSQVV